MGNYQYILYDWDGCLAQTLDVWLDGYKQVCGKENLYPSEKAIVDKAFGKWGQGLANLGCSDPNQAVSDLIAIVEKNLPSANLYPGALEILKQLRTQKRNIALITSSNRAFVEPALKSKNLTTYFDIVLANEDVNSRKPDPEIIHTSLKQLNGTKDQAIIIGDSPHDIKAGHNAGIATVAYFPKHNEMFYSKEELEAENPDYLITRHKELLKFV